MVDWSMFVSFPEQILNHLYTNNTFQLLQYWDLLPFLKMYTTVHKENNLGFRLLVKLKKPFFFFKMSSWALFFVFVFEPFIKIVYTNRLVAALYQSVFLPEY